MASKYNLNLVKTRRCYTPEEIAQLFGISTKTCQRWLQTGLEAIEPNRRPLLIRGSDLRQFLKQQKEGRKRPIRDENEFYCLGCKVVVRARDGTITEVETGKRIGKENRLQKRKIGVCPQCNKQISKYM